MAQSAMPSNVHVSQHPCLRAKLSQLRSASTNAADTKRLVHEISTMVACEAFATGLSAYERGTDESPLSYEFTVEDVSPKAISLIPILRSGLSMLEAVQSLLPWPVSVHHLGMYRDKSTLQAVEYYNNLPQHQHKAGSEDNLMDLAIIIDPIIATGSTVCAAIDTLRDWGVPRIICLAVLCSENGLRRAAELWPEGVEIWAAGCDKETDERGMIKPGLGDIGDRLFLTMGK